MTLMPSTKNNLDQHELSVIEQVVMQGDLSKLDPAQRVLYYNKVCESVGLNPLTRPFDYISLNGKLTLYAKKDCTEQLRKINGISIAKMETTVIDDLYIVKAVAVDKNGRTDEATGAVVFGHLKGEAKANAIMKAETKAKRRVTLSICGMGWCDESEIDSIPNAKTAEVDLTTGEIKTPLLEQKPPVAVITDEQVKCLKFFIDEDEQFEKNLLARLAKKNIFSLAALPVTMFEFALKECKENFAKREEARFGKKDEVEE